MKLEWEKIREIYSLLGDDISKEIFTNRLLYTFTGEKKYIRDIISLNPIMKEQVKQIYSSQKPLAVFGAGMYGKFTVQTFDDIKFSCFIDNYATGSQLDLPIYDLDTYFRHYKNNCKIVIATKLSHDQIYSQLIDVGVPHSDIINLGVVWERMTHEQYLDLPELMEYNLAEGVFVDVGCYDGMTSLDYKKRFGSVNVLAWEPDPDNAVKCIDTFNEYSIQYRLVEKGMWDTEETLRFKQDKTDSAICLRGGVTINTAKLDDYCEEESCIKFIKMDIEGAEYRAILGAQKSILMNNPILAISIYHKPEDIYEIPILIHSLCPSYRFFMRHYAFSSSETVFYALPLIS